MKITYTIRKIFRRKNNHFLTHKELSRKIIIARLQHWAPLCGVSYKRVAIRNQRRRWGSCSSLGNLNFNYKLAFLPCNICDYVIVHELCHLKEMNHGPAFWNEIEKVIPEYRSIIEELRGIERRQEVYLKEAMQSAFSGSYYNNLVVELAS